MFLSSSSSLFFVVVVRACVSEGMDDIQNGSITSMACASCFARGVDHCLSSSLRLGVVVEKVQPCETIPKAGRCTHLADVPSPRKADLVANSLMTMIGGLSEL